MFRALCQGGLNSSCRQQSVLSGVRRVKQARFNKSLLTAFVSQPVTPMYPGSLLPRKTELVMLKSM